MLTPAKYEKTKIIDLDEAMEITGEQKASVTGELKEFLTIDNIIGMHGDLVTMLKETDRHLDEYIAAYEKGGKKDREPLEAVYALKISILDKMARNFNPLSEYGKKKLGEAVKCREEFEELIGPMITRITAENIDLFKTVLSQDVREDIISGRRSALGALRTQKKTVYGVASIVYHLEESVIYEKGSLVIDWLFVNSRFKGRGISNFLIGELINSAVKNGIEDICAEFSDDLPDKKLLSYIFGSWYFDFNTRISSDGEMRIGDITGYKEIKEKNKGANPFSSLENARALKLMRNALARLGYRGYLTASSLPEDYIDRDLSFYMGTEADISAVLLTHRTVTGLVRVEYMAALEGKEELLYNLIAAFLEKAIKACDDDDIVVIPVEAEEIGEYLEKICSKQMGQYLLSGSVNKPLPGESVTPEDIKEALTALDME